MNFGDGLTALDYAEIAENWWVADYIRQRGARPSGQRQHRPRGAASSQLRHPPVRVMPDGTKGDGKGDGKMDW